MYVMCVCVCVCVCSGVGVALAFSFIYICLLRWIAGPIIGIGIALCFFLILASELGLCDNVFDYSVSSLSLRTVVEPIYCGHPYDSINCPD